jgi:proteasome regulatory subunit
MIGFSGAEIRAVCTEAGYLAIRNNKPKVFREDFVSAIIKVNNLEKSEDKDFLRMMA